MQYSSQALPGLVCNNRGADPRHHQEKEQNTRLAVSRWPHLGLPKSAPGCSFALPRSFLMALQKALEGWGSAGRAGLNHSFQNLQKTKNALCAKALLVSPCCRAGATPLVRWAFLFLASRFASSFWCHLTAVTSIKRAVFHHATPKQPELCLHSLPPTLRT